MRRPSGFTLIELLVVLVIIGLVGSVASLAIGRVEGQRDSAVADQLTAWLVAARDRARFDGGIYALEVTPRGAQLHFWLDYQWAEVADGNWTASDGLQLAASGDADRMPVLFLPDGSLSEAGRIELLRDRNAVEAITWQRDGTIVRERTDG